MGQVVFADAHGIGHLVQGDAPGLVLTQIFQGAAHIVSVGIGGLGRKIASAQQLDHSLKQGAQGQNILKAVPVQLFIAVGDLLQKIPQVGIPDGGAKVKLVHGHAVHLKKAFVNDHGANGHSVPGVGAMQHIGIDHHHGLPVYGNLVGVVAQKALSLYAPKQLDGLVPVGIGLFRIDDHIAKINKGQKLVAESVIVVAI